MKTRPVSLALSYILLFILTSSIASCSKNTVNEIPNIPATPDKEGMENDAKALIQKLNLGWNLGNSLDAYNSGITDTETSWGNPMVTESMIKAVKEAGFNAIRIPVRWYPHVNSETDFTIKESWMSRVKEVVDYCINNDLYVILNTPRIQQASANL